MHLRRLHRVQLLPTTLNRAWDFFSDPRNLALITPSSLGLRITSPLPDRMHPGMIVAYTVTPFPPLRLTWITEITHMQEPYFFVDEQRFGPYRFWHHQHTFREVSTGVEMTDLVHFLLPFPPVGRLLAPLVERRLEQIFSFRRDILSATRW